MDTTTASNIISSGGGDDRKIIRVFEINGVLVRALANNAHVPTKHNALRGKERDGDFDFYLGSVRVWCACVIEPEWPSPLIMMGL